MKDIYVMKTLSVKSEDLLPSLSVDCVIFGFHDGVLKILLNKFPAYSHWMLPGGFVLIDEDVDRAAYRVLGERTGLKKIYLTQFYLFGDSKRTDMQENTNVLALNGYNDEQIKNHWLVKRFVSAAYYALVDFSSVKINSASGEDIKWFDIAEIPDLYSDHNKIIDKAISTIRMQLGYVPIGYELLPLKFTMTDLRIIYETILGKPIDRRNFQRKMLSTELVVPLDEVSKKFGIKKTALFSFDKEKYSAALKEGYLF